MNDYGKLRRCTERNGEVVDFYLYLAATLVTLRMLIRELRAATAGTADPPPGASNDPLAGRSKGLQINNLPSNTLLELRCQELMYAS